MEHKKLTVEDVRRACKMLEEMPIPKPLPFLYGLGSLEEFHLVSLVLKEYLKRDVIAEDYLKIGRRWLPNIYDRYWLQIEGKTVGMISDYYDSRYWLGFSIQFHAIGPFKELFKSLR